MGQLGLCVNCLGGGYPDAAELRALGLSGQGWLRTPVQGPLSLLEPMLNLCAAERLKVYVTLNNECDEVKSDWSGWEEALRRLVILARGRVHVVGCGNELDIFYERGDRQVGPQFAVSLVRLALPLLAPQGIKVASPSVAGANWQGYLSEMVRRFGHERPDYVDFHGYGQGFADVPQEPRFGLLADAVDRAVELADGIPLVMSEGGVKIGEVGGEHGQAQYVQRWCELVKKPTLTGLRLGCYFAWSDLIDSPDERGDQAFGLRREDGSPRAAWGVFRQALGGRPVVISGDGEIGQGFRTWQAREPELIGEFMEPREFGPWPGQSAIRTSRGWLFWQHLLTVGPCLSFFSDRGGRFRWSEDWPQSQEIAQ